jgi:hypothetical protein
MIDETETGCPAPHRLAASGSNAYCGAAISTPIRQATMAEAKYSPENAEALAIQALGFVASDPELLPRFLAITGIEARSIRQAAGEPGFLAGVLQFLLAHEPTLLRFAEATGISPSAVGKALRSLPQGDDSYDHSS